MKSLFFFVFLSVPAVSMAGPTYASCKCEIVEDYIIKKVWVKGRGKDRVFAYGNADYKCRLKSGRILKWTCAYQD